MMHRSGRPVRERNPGSPDLGPIGKSSHIKVLRIMFRIIEKLIDKAPEFVVVLQKNPFGALMFTVLSAIIICGILVVIRWPH